MVSALALLVVLDDGLPLDHDDVVVVTVVAGLAHAGLGLLHKHDGVDHGLLRKSREAVLALGLRETHLQSRVHGLGAVTELHLREVPLP